MLYSSSRVKMVHSKGKVNSPSRAVSSNRGEIGSKSLHKLPVGCQNFVTLRACLV